MSLTSAQIAANEDLMHAAADAKRANDANMAVVYPIRLKVSSAALAELVVCEEASYNDATYELEMGRKPSRDPATHAHVVADRYSTQLRIDSNVEAVDMYYAVCSGTFQVTDEKKFLHTARKIADWLRPIVQRVSPETVRLFKQPDGY